ncbi:MAG: hypothetical protein ACYCZH_09115 [Sulfuriferula sp.]
MEKLLFRMIPAPMAGDGAIPAAGPLDATGSNGREAATPFASSTVFFCHLAARHQDIEINGRYH